MRGIWIIAIAAALLLGAASTASAHQSSVKYVDVVVEGPRADVTITIAPSDVTEPLGLPETARPDLGVALAPATVGRVAAYVRGWVTIARSGGPPCVASNEKASPAADGKFVDVRWELLCDGPADVLELDFTRFFAVDLRHEAFVSLHARGATGKPSVVRSTHPKVTLDRRASPSFWQWVRYGMDHIYGGPDHLCFVLALLLVVVLRRERDGTWQVRSPLGALRSTATIITAFTIAHSVTLIAASLGVIELPSRFVESVIAASIVYTAIEDVVRPDVRWRFVMTCAFGLIHGLGFASMLEALLPPSEVVVPLLSFNLGVEIGQLSVVAGAIPVLWAIARLVGAQRYRTLVLPIAAAPLVVVGVRWLIERM